MTTRTRYVGISGFMSRSEVVQALAVLDEHPLPAGWQLMVGVLASEKTLRGERNKYPRRYPQVGDIASIFVSDPRCLNLVHFASDDVPTWWTLDRLIHFAGRRCDGFQFNGAWPLGPDMGAMEALSTRPLRSVLQVRTVGPAAVPDHLYWPPADARATDILLDASGGAGASMDVARARWLVEQARSFHTHWGVTWGIGVAGGLCAEALPEIADLLRDGVSCDAEGRLRDSADGGGNLDLCKVSDYIRAASTILG